MWKISFFVASLYIAILSLRSVSGIIVYLLFYFIINIGAFRQWRETDNLIYLLVNFEQQEVAVKKFLDQDFSGAALAEFKREVSNELAFYICMWYSSLCFEEKKINALLKCFIF